MWATNRLSRTSSMRSMARSVVSSHASSFGDSDLAEEEHGQFSTTLWGQQDSMLQKVGNVAVQIVEAPRRQSFSSRADSEHPTLANDGDYPDHITMPGVDLLDVMHEKTPTAERFSPGPLEQQLAMLMSKIVNIERAAPTIMAEDYKRLEDKIYALEAEKDTWANRHEALFALRDQDLFNLIKVRQLLADECREHDTLKTVRDRDLVHVIELRDKLAQATWTKPQSSGLERRNTLDMWQMAKSAAMEHRCLELEKANEELLQQVAELQNGTEVPRSTTAIPVQTTSMVDWSRMETMHEDNARYREKMAQRMQQLRSEKEVLQRDLSRKEDECSDLEVKIERLQRKFTSL